MQKWGLEVLGTRSQQVVAQLLVFEALLCKWLGVFGLQTQRSTATAELPSWMPRAAWAAEGVLGAEKQHDARFQQNELWCSCSRFLGRASMAQAKLNYKHPSIAAFARTH